MNRKERFKQAFQYLKNNGIIHTQRDVSRNMNATPPNVSRAIQGDEKYLTDNFLRRFNIAFGGLFNEEWLIDGEGEMLSSPPIPDRDTPNGNDSTVNKLIDELTAQRRMTEKALEQNDRLITLLEKETERTQTIVRNAQSA